MAQAFAPQRRRADAVVSPRRSLATIGRAIGAGQRRENEDAGIAWPVAATATTATAASV
jgi:hypothetical protein